MNDKERAQKELDNLIIFLSHKGYGRNTPINRAQYYERDAEIRKRIKTIIKVIDEI